MTEVTIPETISLHFGNNTKTLYFQDCVNSGDMGDIESYLRIAYLIQKG
jgi:hypothetical protein